MWYKVEYTPTLFYIKFGKEKEENVMELTMNLPRNYVEIEEEEMMYLEGGILNHVRVVSFAINVGFNWLCSGGAVRTIKKILSASSIKNGIRKYIGRFLATQALNRFLGVVMGAINSFLSFSIGDAIAKTWNKYDTRPWDNYCGVLKL